MAKPRKLIVPPPTPLGQRAIRLGSSEDFLLMHVNQNEGASAFMQNAIQVVQHAASLQGHFGDVEPFQFEPAAKVVCVAAADAVEELKTEIEDLKQRVKDLQDLLTPRAEA